MSTSNVIIPPDFSKPIIDREKIWTDFDSSRNLAGELNQLGKQIPECAAAEIQVQFDAGSIPPQELQTILHLLKRELETTNRLKTEVKGSQDEIEAIKRKEKTLIIAAIAGG